LPARGARLHIAHVYCRQPVEVPARGHRRLQALGQNTAVLVSSRAAFAEFWRQLDTGARDKIRDTLCIASSARLLEYLQGLGIWQLRLAAGTQPARMLAAVREAIAANESEG
jgi:uroporphyrinogen-III synthase